MVRSPSPVSVDSPQAKLAEARQRLADFEESITHSDLVARLRADKPLHPLLMLRWLALVLCLSGGVSAIGSLIVPWIDRGLAQQLAALETASGLAMPVALGLLTVCAAVVLISAHFAAAAVAVHAPWRPHEAKMHQRLVSDVRQLEAQTAVRDRLTPRGASPRNVARDSRPSGPARRS
jgi:hypothetical protein